MTPKVKNTAIVLGGAVALSSAAYALGAQSGGGNAQAVAGTSASSSTTMVAATSTPARPRFRRGGFGPGCAGPGLDALATKLGVSTAALRGALDAARADLPKPDPAAREKALADALGVSQAKVQAAVGKLRPGRDQRLDGLAKELAGQLGVPESTVTAAFDKLRASGPPRPGDRQDRRSELADAIGVSQAKLD